MCIIVSSFSPCGRRRNILASILPLHGGGVLRSRTEGVGSSFLAPHPRRSGGPSPQGGGMTDAIHSSCANAFSSFFLPSLARGEGRVGRERRGWGSTLEDRP